MHDEMETIDNIGFVDDTFSLFSRGLQRHNETIRHTLQDKERLELSQRLRPIFNRHIQRNTNSFRDKNDGEQSSGLQHHFQLHKTRHVFSEFQHRRYCDNQSGGR